MSTVPIVAGGANIGLMIILHDITREKTVERMKTEFVSLAAHQLRTPLSAIKWTLKMLLEGDMGEITEGQRDLIEKSYQSNERMIGLINDLLDITRIEEGRYLYQPILADLVGVVESALKDGEDEVKRKGLTFHFQKPRGRVPRVTMDVEKIKLVVQNLLENAIRYTPSGGKVSVAISADKNKVEFKIEDGGIGIPKDQQSKIFTKFFRGSNVMRVETEGSGLGLFISKNIIEAHGGRIWFESKEGTGSSFYFSLPVKKELESFLKEF
jgi:signal transduction histidine kinase